jgi:hypothetical protein
MKKTFGHKIKIKTRVVEPHNFYAAPAPGQNFDAAPAPNLLYGKPTFWKQTKIYLSVGPTLPSEFSMIEMVINVNGKNKNCYSLWHF